MPVPVIGQLSIYILPSSINVNSISITVDGSSDTFNSSISGEYLLLKTYNNYDWNNTHTVSVSCDGYSTTSGTTNTDGKVYITLQQVIFISKLSNGTTTYTIKDAEARASISSLATVATTGSYNDLSNKPTIPAAQVNSDWNAASGVAQILNKPTIPTVNNATLTIQKNGTMVNTFTANASSDVTANITVPTKISDLTNDSNFADKDLSNLTSTGKNLGNWSTNVSNCITEIPQDINLTLSNGTLTLKAGSKVYVPNGSGVFDVRNITSDVTLTDSSASVNTWLVAVSSTGTLLYRALANSASGAGATATSGFAYDTTTNDIGWFTAGGVKSYSNVSFPVCICTSNASGFVSIDQVFNGFGYIGSSRFFLPGVKVLIPNGLNSDGTLNNTAYTQTTVNVYTWSSSANTKNFCTLGEQTDNFTPYYEQTTQPTTSGLWYNPKTNLLLRSTDNGATWVQRKAAVYAEVMLSSGTITSFSPKTAFHAVDYSEYDNFKVDALTKDEQNVKLTGTQTITGAKTFSSTVTVGSSSFAYNGHLELVPASSATNGGYLDFHYAGSSSDYTSRLIEDVSGHLSYLGSAALSSEHSTSSNVVATKGWTNATVNEMRTNCITEIPQDITLTLSNGTLTLKAGSKLYQPDGTIYNVTTDKTTTITTNGTFYVVLNPADGYLNRGNYPASSGSSTPATPSTGDLWHDTANNYVKRYSNGWSVMTLPLAIVTVSNGAISSIDQVFNGFGYIGSTVFALPGVKGLIPNGRNTDGTLKSTAIALSSVITRTFSSAYSGDYAVFLNSSAFGALKNTYSYDEANNRNKDGSSDYNSAYIGTMHITSGVINKFNTKTAFHAVDYSDWNEHRVVEFRETSSATEYKAYRKYSDGTIDQWGFINNATWSSYQYTVTLPVAMRDALYASVATPYGNPPNDDYITNIQTQDTTTLTIRLRSGHKSCSWIVHGMAA